MNSTNKISLKNYEDKISLKNKVGRLLWNITYILFFRPFGTKYFRRWRLFILKIYGAKIHSSSTIYSTTKIWAPWNLEMGSFSLLGPYVDSYNPDKVIIGTHCIVSQKAYLCTASHDVMKPKHPLITAPIILQNQSWVAASAFVGMGVIVGEGSVVGVTASVYKNVEAWTIVGGNPAKFIKKRVIVNEE